MNHIHDFIEFMQKAVQSQNGTSRPTCSLHFQFLLGFLSCFRFDLRTRLERDQKTPKIGTLTKDIKLPN